MGIIYAIINGMLFFKEIPTPIAWVGISVVFIGLLMNVFSERILAFFKTKPQNF
jgi:drug/metabolite transporter (DMT)-like permease